tara:strand:+ start:96 stop:278 length:183 start_codon:yes stop_codon:yes gene_type:complete
MAEFIIGNWEYFLLGLMIAEKVVKLTPTKYDDIALDMVLKPIIYGIAGKKKEDSSGELSE